jgi:hypothetical protein
MESTQVKSGRISDSINGEIPVNVLTWHFVGEVKVWIHSRLQGRTYKTMSISVQAKENKFNEVAHKKEVEARLKLAQLIGPEIVPSAIEASIFRHLQVGGILDIHASLISDLNVNLINKNHNNIRLVINELDEVFNFKLGQVNKKSNQVMPRNLEMRATKTDCLLIAHLYSEISSSGYKKPAQKTAELLGVATKIVYVAIRTARKNSWLTSAGFGIPGGQITEQGLKAFNEIDGKSRLEELIRRYGGIK